MENSSENKKDFTCLIPIYGLNIPKKPFNGEFKIGGVLFIDTKKIPRVRKRLGIMKAISKYKSRSGWEDLLNASETYAVVRNRRKHNDDNVSCEYKLIRDALLILASSLIGNHWGRFKPSMKPPNKNMIEDFVLFENDSEYVFQMKKRFYALENVILNQQWQNLSDDNGFFHLVKALNNKISVTPEWRKSLKRTAILTGRAYLSDNLYDSFLFNFFAIENLLSQKSGKKIDADLIEKIFAFFGWFTKESIEPWQTVIKRLWELRCKYVHNGEISGINGIDLYNSELLLRNLQGNIYTNLHKLKSKSDISKFSEKVKARQVLGLPQDRKELKLHFISKPKTKEEFDALAIYKDIFW